MNIHEIVAKWNDKCQANSIESLKKVSWFNELPQAEREERLEKSKQDDFKHFLILAEIVVEKGDRLCAKVRDGGFDPRNPISRGIFQDLTGVTLPGSKRKTIETIKAWLGPIWADYNIRCEAEWKAKEERKQREKEAAARKEIEDTEAAIREGRGVDARQLIDVCAAHGIEIPLRTKGSMLASTENIRADTMTVTLRRGREPRFQHHPPQYYKAVEAILKGEDPSRYLPPKKVDPYAGLSPERATIEREIDTLRRKAEREHQIGERVRINTRIADLMRRRRELSE